MEWERGKTRRADELAEIPFWEEGTGYKNPPRSTLASRGNSYRFSVCLASLTKGWQTSLQG